MTRGRHCGARALNDGLNTACIKPSSRERDDSSQGTDRYQPAPAAANTLRDQEQFPAFGAQTNGGTAGITETNGDRINEKTIGASQNRNADPATPSQQPTLTLTAAVTVAFERFTPGSGVIITLR